MKNLIQKIYFIEYLINICRFRSVTLIRKIIKCRNLQNRQRQQQVAHVFPNPWLVLADREKLKQEFR